MATVRVIKTKFKLNSTTEVRFKNKIPSQAVTGPGIIGKKLPIIPKRHKINPVINKNKSNLQASLVMEVAYHRLLPN